MHKLRKSYPVCSGAIYRTFLLTAENVFQERVKTAEQTRILHCRY